MKEVIYKFLDDYVGDGVICKKPPLGSGLVVRNVIHRTYGFYSNKDVLIFDVLVSEDGDHYKFFCSNELSKTVSRFFGVEEPFNYVRDWFGQKYGMKKVSDISKFII